MKKMEVPFNAAKPRPNVSLCYFALYKQSLMTLHGSSEVAAHFRYTYMFCGHHLEH